MIGTLKTLSPRVGPTLSSNRFAIMTVVWFVLCPLSTLVSRLFCRKTEAGRTFLVHYSPPALFKLQPSNVLCSFVQGGLVEAPVCRDVDPGDSNACLGKRVQTVGSTVAGLGGLADGRSRKAGKRGSATDLGRVGGDRRGGVDVRMLAVSSDVARGDNGQTALARQVRAI